MSDRKNWGSTVLGWFVTKEGEGGGAAPADAAPPDSPLPPGGGSLPGEASAAAPPLPVAFAKEPPPAPGGNVDYPAVFDAAGIDEGEQGYVGKALELLASLPAGTDPAVRKQIVGAALRAFGVPVEKIIEAAAQEIQALEGYIRAGAADTAKVSEDAGKRIGDFEAEIGRLRTVVGERIAEQKAVTAACNGKKLEVQSVLEFFGREAVAKVVQESPKLVDPSAPPPAPPVR
jgi:hypothetical protein